MVLDYLHKEFPELAADLERVKRLMKESVVLKNESVRQAIFELFDAGGKMLRPAYLLLFSDFTDLENEQCIALASAVEMLHTATLIHDDIVDKALTRRGTATISALYGADVAVYAGDYLFVSVFKTLSKQTLDTTALLDQVDSIEKLLGGELGQMHLRYDLNQSISDYLENVSGKTAELFAMSCAAPALIAENKKVSKLAFEIGKDIGIAFQIMDDYLDYSANEQALGKPVLEDIRQGIYSAPILYALELEPERLKAILQSEKFEKIPGLLTETKALERTKELARDYTKSALKLINKLPGSEAKQRILSLTQKILERDY